MNVKESEFPVLLISLDPDSTFPLLPSDYVECTRKFFVFCFCFCFCFCLVTLYHVTLTLSPTPLLSLLLPSLPPPSPSPPPPPPSPPPPSPPPPSLPPPSLPPPSPPPLLPALFTYVPHSLQGMHSSISRKRRLLDFRRRVHRGILHALRC